MTGRLRSIGVSISERKVGNALKKITHKLSGACELGDRLILKSKADYFGRKLHVDQNENLHLKLVMHDETHVVARNGYSGMITGYTTMAIKND